MLPARPGDGRFEPLEPGAPAGLDACGVALETPVERLDEGGADPAGALTEILTFVTHGPSPMPGKAGRLRPAYIAGPAPPASIPRPRSAARRVGQECVSTCKSR